MTAYEKLKDEVDAIPEDDPHRELLRRLLDKIRGQTLAYKDMQTRYTDVVEKLKDKKRELSLQAYKALGLERLIVRIYAFSEVAGATVDFQSWVHDEIKPYLTAAGYDFERQRFGIDE